MKLLCHLEVSLSHPIFASTVILRECKLAIEEMKKAREKWLINRRREKEEQEYHHKSKEAHKIIRNKEKTYMKNVIESIEEDQKHYNTRKMYQTVNQFKKGYQHKFNAIRNKKRRIGNEQERESRNMERTF